MTRALMRVQFWVNGQYSPRTEPTERQKFTQNWTHWIGSVLDDSQYSPKTEPTERPIFTQNWTHWTVNIHPELNPLGGKEASAVDWASLKTSKTTKQNTDFPRNKYW